MSFRRAARRLAAQRTVLRFLRHVAPRRHATQRPAPAMTIKEYIAASGSRLSDADAMVAGPELMKLAGRGHSSAHHIVSEARKKNSPLHRFFEWDDAAAAETHRLFQARALAGHILVKVVSPTGSERVLRAFHAVRVEAAGAPSRQKHYLPIEVVEGEPEYAEQVVEEALKQLRGWRDRWQNYREHFGPIFPAIDEMLVEEEVAA